LIPQRELRCGARKVELRNQSVAGSFIGALKDGVVGEQRIAREVHLRHQPAEDALAEERVMDMRRTPGVPVIAPRIRSRLDGKKGVAAVRVRERAPAAGEVGVERGVVVVALVRIAARGVALPQLDQRAAHRPAALVEHAAADRDALANGRTGVLSGEIAVRRPHRLVAEDRAAEIGFRPRQHHQRLQRRASPRRNIRRMQVRRLAHAHAHWNGSPT
jgi:hypothetical protein